MKRFLMITLIVMLMVSILPVITESKDGIQEDKKDKLKDKMPQVRYKVDVELRLIDVIVLDSSGNHVTDLKPEDFTIYEEGVDQEIATFDNILYKIKNPYLDEDEEEEKVTIKQPEEKPESAEEKKPVSRLGQLVDAPPDALGRSIVLLFDNYNTHYPHLVRAKKAAKEFITNDLLPEDRVAVVKYYGSAKVLQDFTNDKGKLIEAINTLSISLGDAVGRPEISDESSSMRMQRGGTQGNALQWTDPMNPYATDGNWDYSEKYYNVQNFMDSLNTVGYSLKEISGRKTIIFLSPGFLGVSPVRHPWMFVNMSRMLEKLSGYNVTLYSVDVSGVATDPRGKREERWDFMTYVSEKTGGRLFKNRNDLIRQLQKVNYEMSHFYMLGYYSNNIYDDGRFLKIKVECKRPGTEVRTVRGLYSSKSWDRLTADERKNILHRFLDQGVLFPDLPLKIDSTATIPAVKGDLVYPLTIRFPVFSDYKKYESLSYDLYLRIKNEMTNEMVSTFFQEIRLDKETLIGDEIIVNLPMELPTGSYMIEVILKNNISKDSGSKFIKIEIPQKINEFAITEPKLFTAFQSATILFPDKENLIDPDLYYPHVRKNLIPVTGTKLYRDVDNYLQFALINFPMDVNKKVADMDLQFFLLQGKEPITTKFDIKKFYDGEGNQQVMSVLLRIPANSIENGRYDIRLICKNNKSGEIYAKNIPVYFTQRKKSPQTAQADKKENNSSM